MLDIYSGVAELCRAFHPLVCAADIYDFQQQLRYRVFDPVGGNPIVCVTEVPVRTLLNPAQLHAEIVATRNRLRRLGFSIDQDAVRTDAGREVFERSMT